MAHAGGGRRRRHGAAEHENDERWLLTYSDMITLLMALFMVLFSISSVNVSKFETLQRALQDAFSGRVLPGGKSIKDAGGSESGQQALPQPPLSAIPTASPDTQRREGARRNEQERFERLKRQLDAYARQHGLAASVHTSLDQRGLVIRLLTDRVLFDTADGQLKPAARPVLTEIASLVGIDATHPVEVQGFTDTRPIHSERYPSNWELSSARASSVVRFLIGGGVAQARLSASGYASLHPIASNSTEDGRARNRRVEIVLLRTRAPGALLGS